jgi:hypothetical protein
MKASRVLTLLLGSSLLLSASVFAGSINKKSLHLYQDVTIEGKQVPAGDYKVEWNGTGPDVKVNIVKGKDTVASFSARVISENIAHRDSGYTAAAEKDGSQAVTQVFFSGEKFDLDLDQAGNSSTAPASTTTGTN